MKVAIDLDERMEYSLEKGEKPYRTSAEVSPAFMAEYRRIERDWNRMQKRLEKLYTKGAWNDATTTDRP